MGKKYIIELEDKPFHKDGDFLCRVKGFNSLVFDMTGISKLTPYHEPDLGLLAKENFERGYRQRKAEDEKDIEQVRKEAYEKGLSDAWEAARKIGSNSMCSLKEMGFDFSRCVVADYNPSWFVVKNYSASECIEKIRQYEQEKEEQKQLQVGDEVKLKRCDIYAVYMGGVNGSNECNVYLCFNDGSCGVQSKSEIERKTGRHFPEIAEVLRKMREGQDG